MLFEYATKPFRKQEIAPCYDDEWFVKVFQFDTYFFDI
jgi:hypothetical protein